MNGSSGTAWTQIFWRNVKCFKIKIPNLNQIRLFSKKLIMSILSIYECLTSCKKSEKTNERFTQVLHVNADFWCNAKCFNIKIPHLSQTKTFLKKIDYANFEYLWMSNFMQKIRKSKWTVLQVLHVNADFWR